MNWYIADPHFFHKNIIRHTARPYKNIKEMHSSIIKNINDRVQVNDTLYWIGDFAMVGTNAVSQLQHLMVRMNGRHVLILGNHDEMKPFRYVEAGFQSVHTSLETVDEGRDVVMNHDPSVACLVPNEKIFLCGHVHTLFKTIPEHNTANMCVENWGYAPANLDQIIKALKGEEIQ